MVADTAGYDVPALPPIWRVVDSFYESVLSGILSQSR